MAKSPQLRSRKSRSNKSRTGATRCAQLGGKKKDNKQRVAEANKLKKAAEPDILQTTSGDFKVMDVNGQGNCAMLTVWALYEITRGVPYDEVAAAVYPTGDITQDLTDELQGIRNTIAIETDDVDLPGLGDGVESKPLERVLHNSDHEIETKDMFRAVMLFEDGYLDPLAMHLVARHLKLDGFRVVQLVDGVLESCDQRGDLTDTDVNLALFDGESHFSALIPTTPEVVQPEDTGTSTSEPDAGATPAKQEAAEVAVQPEDAGTSTSEPDAGATPAKQEAAEVAVQPEDAGTSTSEPDAGATPAKQEAAEVAVQPEDAGTSTSEPDAGATPAKQEDAGTSTSEPDAASVDVSVMQQDGAFDAGDGGDEWVLVGGRPMISREVRPTEHTYTHENSFDVLSDEDEEDDEAGMFTVVWEPFPYEQKRRNNKPREAKRPARSKRRVAGRRKAQPSKRGGQGGSKYLKRCPARDTRVQRKRYRGREQQARGTTWSGVVRGGAHPGHGKAPAFGGAIPSASTSDFAPSPAESSTSSTDSAPSNTPSADPAEGSTSSTDSAPSTTPSVDSAEGSTAPSAPGGGPGENTPEGRDAMDVQKAHEASMATRVARPDGKCKDSMCGKAATYCFKEGEVEYCDTHYPSRMGWAVKIGGKRSRKPSHKLTRSAEASDDDSGRDGGRGAKRNAGGGGGRGGGRGGNPKTGGGNSDGGGGGGYGNDDDGADPMEVSETTSASSPIDSRDEDGEPAVGETAPAFDGAVPAVSASSAPSSIDSRDGGEGGGKGKGKGKAKQREPVVTTPTTDNVGAGEKKRKYSREGNGHKDLGDRLCEPWDDETKQRMESNKQRAKEQVTAYKGTYDGTKKRKDEAMTFPGLLQALVGGLTEDGKGQLEIVPGKVYFKRDKLPPLKKWYNMNAKYNPADIGVVLEETCVKINGVVYTVESVEEGSYSLHDVDIRLGQWELLESLCSEDGGVSKSPVTLEEDQLMFIRALYTWHEIIYRSFLPWLKSGQEPAKGVKPISVDGMLNDWSRRRLSSEDEELLESVAKMRRLSKLAFVNTSVADMFHTLPVRVTEEGDAGHDEAQFLRDFASSEGSLCTLNGLDWLREHDALMDDNDKKIMVDMSPKHGSYHQHINHALKLLQYAFRLNRTISLQEAFLPICADERAALIDHFPYWEDNEEKQEDFLAAGFRINATPGEMTIAMRFSLKRSRSVITDIPPTAITVLARNDDTHGTTTDKSNNTQVYTKIGKALSVCSFVMKRDSKLSQEKQDATTKKLKEVFDQTRILTRKKRNDADAEEKRNSGRRGPAKKTRLGQSPFIGFTFEECFAQMELLFEGLYINGMKLVLDGIQEIDKTCLGDDGWCYDILRAAEVASTDLRKKSVGSVDTGGRLQGNAEQQRNIAAVVKGLKAKGIGREHFELASAATSVRDAFSSDPLRNQGFFYRRKAVLSVNNRSESRNLGRMVVGLPDKNKVSGHQGNGFAHEHIIDRDCGYWYAVTVVIGEAFFKSYDNHEVDLSPYIGPVDADGVMMTEKRFNGILKKIGRAYLGVENLTYNKLRTACGTLVMHACTALGMPMDHPAVKDFVDRILSSIETMMKNYDVHRAVTRQSRRVEFDYQGVVDFSGGPYGILKGAVEREREMGEGGKASSAGWSDSKGAVEQENEAREQAVRVAERENKAREQAVQIAEREHALMKKGVVVDMTGRALEMEGGSSAGAGVNERTSAELLCQFERLRRQLAAKGVVVEMTERASTPVEPEQAPNAPTGGALQSQCTGEDRFEVNGEARLRRCERPAVNETCFCADHQRKASGGSSANDSDGHETGAKRKRATCETSDDDAGVKKKSATVKTEEEYTYNAYEKFKPTRVRNKTSDKFVLPDKTREGLVKVLGEIKAAFARARERGVNDTIWKRLSSKWKFRNGHYGTINYLRKHDEKFDAGDWYMDIIASIPKNGQNHLIKLIAELQHNDKLDDSVDDKFYWEWWSK